MARPTLWCRLYSEILEDPKVQMLPGAVFKFWVNCLAIATRNEGQLPSDAAISWALRMPETDVKRFMERLREAVLVEGSRKIHNWDSRQYLSDNSTDRVRKHREKHLGNVSGNVSASVSVSDSVSKVLSKKTSLPKTGVVANSFRLFWDRWCFLTGRKQRESFACQAWISVVEFATEPAAMGCLERYGASDEVKRGIVTNADRWIYDQVRDGFKGEWQSRVETPSKMDRTMEILVQNLALEGKI